MRGDLLAGRRDPYLYPHHDTVAAREFADALFAELPLEVVNLDSGERQLARLGVGAWDSPRT